MGIDGRSLCRVSDPDIDVRIGYATGMCKPKPAPRGEGIPPHRIVKIT
jgi:hypothetical protein